MSAVQLRERGSPPRWANSWGQDSWGVFAGFVVDGVEYRMRWIHPGEFWMGSPEDEEGRFPNEGPRHRVTIRRGFWLGETPVTQGLWKTVMGTNPSTFKGDERPVETVSLEDCRRFCAALERLIPGFAGQLPSEAEWEYACRAGAQGPTYAGAGAQALDRIAWWSGNCGETHPVRQKQPNAWGLHDVLGNVWEWCRDGERPYSRDAEIDPVGPVNSDLRGYRGGSWDSSPKSVRAACRYHALPGDRYRVLGFRLARSQE